MIISVTEFRALYDTDLTDEQIQARLDALEQMIRAYTNNNFQRRAFRCKSAIVDGAILAPSAYFSVGDTVQISNSEVNDGIYVIGEGYALTPTPYNNEDNTITKVEYPADVKMGVVNLMKWDIDNRDRIGISSETISRHSVSYTSLDGGNSLLGYPAALVGFLTPHMKARF